MKNREWFMSLPSEILGRLFALRVCPPGVFCLLGEEEREHSRCEECWYCWLEREKKVVKE